LPRRLGTLGLVTELLDEPDGDDRHLVIVLDDENAPGAVRRRPGGGLLRRQGGGLRAREEQLHGRPAPYLGLDLDAAARLLGETVDLAEAETGPLAGLLGGK